MSNLRFSLLVTFLASNGATAVNFLVSIALARLLSPKEIGIFSIAAVLVSIAHIFRDFGVGSYLQREKDLTAQKVRTASGVLFASSWSFALILFLSSPLAADYFRQPEVEDVVQVLALGFLFIPFGAITHSLLTRELRAKEQALASIFGVSAFATSSIILAYLGFGHMTMAWANLINILVTAIAYVRFRPSYAPWLPSLRGWREVVNFGTGAVLSNSIGAVNTAIPDVVLGKMSGPHEVGLMSRANSTTGIFTQIFGPTVNYAVLPILARKHHAAESLSEPLAKGIAYLTGCAWPAILLTAIFAHQVVSVLYGEKWLECVPIVQILCVTALISTPFAFNNAAFMAVGKPYAAAFSGGASVILKAVSIAAVFDGTLSSFAYALLIATPLGYPIHLWLQRRHLNFNPVAFLRAQSKSLVLTTILGCVGWVLHVALVQVNALLQLLILAAAIAPLWLYLVRRIDHPMLAELIALADRSPGFHKLLTKTKIL